MQTKEELARYIAAKIAELDYPREAGGLIAPMRHGLEAGGKHLRPVLTVATCAALGGSVEQAVNQAIGVEIFHNFTLVHDDVMDRSDLRRGKPTVRAAYGDEMAILSGDAMLTLACMKVACGAGAYTERVLGLFNTGAMEVYAGQELDMSFESRTDVSTREYLNMILLKTAALIRCACSIGAVMAGASREAEEAMKAYAIGLGMAFQLRDDYLDTYGDEATFGKPIGGDIINNKKTWLLTTALESDDAGALREIIGRGDIADAEKIALVRGIYDDLGLPKKCQDLIGSYSDMAVMALDDAGMSAADREFFADIANGARTRSI